jgi:hypothetical protein
LFAETYESAVGIWRLASNRFSVEEILNATPYGTETGSA